MNSLTLDLVHEGMDVLDFEGQSLGKVVVVRYGEGDILPAFPIVVDILKDSLYGTGEFHPSVYIRFYKEGFLRINRGALAPDLFAFPTQISEIRNGMLVLNVAEEDLLEA
jgi:hypothetical protein